MFLIRVFSLIKTTINELTIAYFTVILKIVVKNEVKDDIRVKNPILLLFCVFLRKWNQLYFSITKILIFEILISKHLPQNN